MKKKPEPKSGSPVRDEEFSPWNGITLNRCLAVAAIAALLSMGFQVLQDAAEDDLADEAEIWTPPDQSDELSEPWFFEAWFGSDEPELPVAEQPAPPNIEESDHSTVEEAEPPEDEEQELTSEEVDETIESEEDLITKESPHHEKTESQKDSQKPTEQWGLKPKSKYMEAKAIKIRTATEDGSQRRDVFPFHKKPKESIKYVADAKEKSYKEKNYQKKYENKYDHLKKQDFGKPYRKEKEEQNKYFKQDKGRREDKESKGYKQYHQEKDYKRKPNSRH
ncbi:junctional sarcoplasmic reticulum protein 1 [Dendropsophus ebraccatus]|uniref:junctional sarcoplasmic reticulum protein 1 n=1 Tax=Dendropsophus ebraccatus TaxID=150705 RepID=UPI0038318D70